MRAVRCVLSIFQLLGASLAATIPATSILTLPNSTLLSDIPDHPFELGVPAPAAPYNVLQGPVHLAFYDYGAPLPPGPAREIVNTVLTRIVDEHGTDHGEKIGREVVYTLDLIGIAGKLRFSVEPESNMTWEMFATAAAGVGRFLGRWDNVEFTVDVSMWKEGPGKVGTVYMSRYRF